MRAAGNERAPPASRLQLLCLSLVSPIIQILASGLLTVALLLWAPRLTLLYLTYVYFDRSPSVAGWHWPGALRLRGWLRNLWIWRYCATYFPAALEKTVELPPGTPYLFGCEWQAMHI